MLHCLAALPAIFFVVGFVLMLTLNEKAGRIAALKAERKFQRRVSQRQG